MQVEARVSWGAGLQGCSTARSVGHELALGGTQRRRLFAGLLQRHDHY